MRPKKDNQEILARVSPPINGSSTISVVDVTVRAGSLLEIDGVTVRVEEVLEKPV